MDYQISTKGYETKPNDPQWKSMKWERVSSDTPTLISYLQSGHTYRANLDSVSNSGKKRFISSQVILLDIEKKTDNPPVLKDFIEFSKIKPSFYYESFSSKEGNRYRLGYILDKPVTDIHEYKAMTKAIIDYTGVLTEGMVDPKSYDPRQNFCGTNKGVEWTCRAYRKSDIRKIAEKFIEEDTEKIIDEKPVHKLTFEEYDLMCDFTATDGTFEAWIRDNSTGLPFASETPPTDLDETYFYYDNYITLVRKLVNGSYYHLCDDGKYRNNTFHDGEHRRKKIITNCSLLHQIYPSCSLKELLVLTCQMFLLFFSNDKEDKIGRPFIWKTVINEWYEPMNAKTPYTIKKRFKFKLYDDEGKRIHWKKQSMIHYSELCLSMYDFSIPIEENLKALNEYLSTTKDDFRFSLSLIESYLDKENLFWFSDKEKPIKTLKRMVKSGVARKECLDFLLSNKDYIGRKQFYEYKKRLTE